MRTLPVVLVLVSLPCSAGPNWPVHNRTTFERSQLFTYLNFGQEGKVEENKDDPATLNRLVYRSSYEVYPSGGKVKVTLVYSTPYRTSDMSFHSISLNLPAFKGEPPVFQEAALTDFLALIPATYAKEVQAIRDEILATQKQGETLRKVYALTKDSLLTVDIGTREVFLNLRP